MPRQADQLCNSEAAERGGRGMSDQPKLKLDHSSWPDFIRRNIGDPSMLSDPKEGKGMSDPCRFCDCRCGGDYHCLTKERASFCASRARNELSGG
jgi:hypothetical protein